VDDFDELRADPIGWILSNIQDDLAGIEWVLDDMDADDILDPALNAYIIPQFEKAGIAVPERIILIEGINQLIKRLS
jgi:hypothetical protein